MAKVVGIETYRRVVTRVILGVLCLAVASSLLGIFSGPSLDAGRFWASVFVSFGCSVALFLCSRALASPKSQRAGLFAIVVVLLCYALALAATWAPPGFAFWASSEHLSLSATFLLLSGVIAAFMFQIVGDPDNRLAGIAGLIMSVVGFGFLQAYAFSDNRFGEPTFLAFGMIGLGSALLLAACLAGAGRTRRPWRWLGVLATVGAYLTTTGLWSRFNDYNSGNDLRNDVGLLAALWEIAGLVAVANLLWLADLTPKQGKLLRWPTLISSAIAAALCVWICLDGASSFDDPIRVELMGAFCVLSIAGLLATQILSNMRRKPEDAVRQYEVTHVQLICPYCKQERSITIGGGTCTECGMQFVVQVREPRCPQCEYSLLMNRSGRCPECGWVIPPNFGAAPTKSDSVALGSAPATPSPSAVDLPPSPVA